LDCKLNVVHRELIDSTMKSIMFTDKMGKRKIVIFQPATVYETTSTWKREEWRKKKSKIQKCRETC